MGGVAHAISDMFEDVFKAVGDVIQLFSGHRNEQQQQQPTMTTGVAPSGGGSSLQDEESSKKKVRKLGTISKKMVIPIISDTSTVNTGNEGVGVNTGGSK